LFKKNKNFSLHYYVRDMGISGEQNIFWVLWTLFLRPPLMGILS